jgi:hypothetical protein
LEQRIVKLEEASKPKKGGQRNGKALPES